jgi:hypothetical protein
MHCADLGNLTPNPFPSGKGNRIVETPSTLQCVSTALNRTFPVIIC